MDNPVDNSVPADRLPSVAFRPDRRFTAGAIAGVVVFAALCVVADDGPSRLLFAVAVVVLGAFAVGDLVYTPRLTASRDGVVVRSPLARATLTWPDVEAVRVDVRPRLGIRSSTLEVDAGETLVVFSRRSLGAEPEDVARLVNAFRPPG